MPKLPLRSRPVPMSEEGGIAPAPSTAMLARPAAPLPEEGVQVHSDTGDLDAALAQELGVRVGSAPVIEPYQPDPRALATLSPESRAQVNAILAQRDQKRKELTATESLMAGVDKAERASEQKPGRRRKQSERGATPSTTRVATVRPWDEWSAPQCVEANLHDLRVWAEESDKASYLYLGNREGKLIAEVTLQAIQELGTRTTFPTEFVLFKVSRNLASRIINERIEASRNLPMLAVLENDLWTNLLPAWREVVPSRQIADIMFDTLLQHYPEIEIETCDLTWGKLRLQLFTPVCYPISDKQGDAVRMGVDLVYTYGGQFRVSLLLKRVLSNSHLLADCHTFSWRSRGALTAECQIRWLQQSTLEVIGGYADIVERAKAMARAQVDRNPYAVVRRHAHSMGFPKRYVAALIAAFDAEPDPNEWAMAVAFSRVAHHKEVEHNLSRGIMLATGNWVQKFSYTNPTSPDSLERYTYAVERGE